MNSNNKRNVTIHGVTVTQMNLQGNWYTPVDGRVKIAEQADPAQIRRDGAGYHVMSVQIMPVGDRWAYHCMVEYPAGSGVVKPGTDFIDMKDNAGIAKAETSAIGRALGLHGIACEESIASAEEVERATDNTTTAPQRTPQANLTAQPKHAPADTSATPAPAQTRGTQDKPAPEMTRQHFLLAAAELGYSPRSAMEALGVRTLDGLNLAMALEKLQAASDAVKPEHDLSTLGNGGGRH